MEYYFDRLGGLGYKDVVECYDVEFGKIDFEIEEIVCCKLNL